MASKDSPRRPSPDAPVPQRPVLMGPPPIPRVMPILPDSYFKSDRISGLNIYNFDQFISSKEKALVLFYDSTNHTNPCLEKEFVNATERHYPDYHGFASVDCSINNKLCQQERVCTTPIMKLYSNGFEVSRMEDATMNATQMQMLMKMTPVLTNPRKLLDQMPNATLSRKKVKMGTQILGK